MTTLPDRLEEAEAGRLILPLKAEYFDAIRDGSKTEEYRLVTPYWTRRLLDGSLGLPRSFGAVVLTKGYPKRDDCDRRMVRSWRGFRRTTVTHPHFGPEPVEVYAIDVSEPAPAMKGEG